jgi:hypothetical protein
MPIYLGDKEISKEYVDSYDSGLLYLGSNIVQGNINYKVSDLGLVAYYDTANPSSYTSGSSYIYDLSGYNNNLTMSVPLSYSAINGGTLIANNSYAYVSPSNGTPSGSSVTQPNFSFGFWAKYARTGSNASPTPAFGFGSVDNGQPGYLAQVNISSSTDLYFGSTFVSDPAPPQPVSIKVTSSFNTKNWYNIMVTYSGSNDVNTSPGLAKVYVNGQIIGSGSMAIVVSQQGTPISIGIPNGYDVNSRGNGFDGTFAIGYIYNRLLNDNEVAFNYNANKNRFGY